MNCEDRDTYKIKSKRDELSDVLCVGDCESGDMECDICGQPIAKIAVDDISIETAKNNFIAAAAMKEAAAADLVSAEARALLLAAFEGNAAFLDKVIELNKSLESLLIAITSWEMTTAVNIDELLK
jgi:hypothetical protein